MIKEEKKPIFTGFAPNMIREHVRMACGFLFLPWRWRELRFGNAPTRVVECLKSLFGATHAYVYDSGRTGLQHALLALGAGEGVDVLVQAYTCGVVINAIKWTGARPVYVDSKDDLTMDPEDMKRKITDRTKMVIIQHTFGVPADRPRIVAIAKEHGLGTISDCAHVFHGTSQGTYLGTLADIGMFSFGSDKIISCGRGGALITNQEELGQKLKALQETLSPMPRYRVLQHLVSFPMFAAAKPVYFSWIGMLILKIGKTLHLMNRVIYEKEKKGQPVAGFPAQLPNALASILLEQLDHIDDINAHRKMIVKRYKENITPRIPFAQGIPQDLPYLFYTIRVPHARTLHKAAKKYHIVLGHFWSGSVILPRDMSLDVMGYALGTCPRAEALAHGLVNLPTHRNISIEDADRIIACVNECA